jgi:hypothetical protein
MSALKPCAKRRPRQPRKDWTQWCVPEELDQAHAVSDTGELFEHLVLVSAGVDFKPGMRIRHVNGNTLDNRRHNLEIVFT